MTREQKITEACRRHAAGLAKASGGNLNPRGVGALIAKLNRAAWRSRV